MPTPYDASAFSTGVKTLEFIHERGLQFLTRILSIQIQR